MVWVWEGPGLEPLGAPSPLSFCPSEQNLTSPGWATLCLPHEAVTACLSRRCCEDSVSWYVVYFIHRDGVLVQMKEGHEISFPLAGSGAIFNCDLTVALQTGRCLLA